MGKWVDTEFGKRYSEDYGSCTAFFTTEPVEDEKRFMPVEIWEIIFEARLEQHSREKGNTM